MWNFYCSHITSMQKAFIVMCFRRKAERKRSMSLLSVWLCSGFALYKLLSHRCLIGLKPIFTVRNSSCGKVMFSQACVRNSVHGGGRCTLIGQTHLLWTHTPSLADTPFTHTHPNTPPDRRPRWPLQRMVRILLECILVC